MRATILALATALMLGGCGSNAGGTSGGEPIDLAVPAAPDLAAAGGSCTMGNAQACGGSCGACLLFGGVGVCVTPCATTSASGCAAGQTCHAIAADGGADVELAGACGGFDGYCA